MGQFELYFRLGTGHILDLAGFDHILFVVVLCSLYTISDWKKVVLLVSAFTIGHSLTLVLATFELILVNSSLIEFLIPLTIAITAGSNILNPRIRKGVQLNHLFAIFFGLIHGLGFSNYLKALIGKEASVFIPLLAFNIGLEAGQLLIVLAFLLASCIPLYMLKIGKRGWTLLVSAIILLLSLMMMTGTKFW